MKHLTSLFIYLSVIQVLLTGPIYLPIQKKLRSATANTSNGELILGTNSGLIYTGNITVGSTNLETSLIFDTGSNIMWIAADQKLKGNVYSCTSSTTCYATTQKETLTYGVGQISGEYVLDNIQVAGIVSPCQHFIEATTLE
jgi:hypothetical protein